MAQGQVVQVPDIPGLLANAAVYNGPWHDCVALGTTLAVVNSFSDQASAAGGVLIQETDDPTNANMTSTSATGTSVANTLFRLHVVIRRRYWRVQYTNGAVTQTVFAIFSVSNTDPTNLCDTAGNQFTSPPNTWAIFHTPAAATQATISKAAVPGFRHVCQSITYSVEAVALQGGIQINLRDGATGAGTVLWAITLALPVGGHAEGFLTGLSIPGSVNTAMTLESSAAPAATNLASVSLTGYDIP